MATKSKSRQKTRRRKSSMRSRVPMARGRAGSRRSGSISRRASVPAPSEPRTGSFEEAARDVKGRAEIGPDGVPVSVSVAKSSGSRLLDRAAADAVLRWRFQPAQLNGQPTVGTVMVPIEFRPN